MSPAFLSNLSGAEIETFVSRVARQSFAKDALIFSEGDDAGAFFIIESGSVSVFCEDGKDIKQIATLKAGECFGEMAIINQDKRSASVMASEDTALLCMSREAFLQFTEEHPELAGRINQHISLRNEELILREHLLDTTGINKNKLYVSIKGDPSLRETAFARERYESVVDQFQERLIPNLKEIIINRCVYQIMVNLNSGEVRTRSVFDPFQEEIHTSDKLADKAYVDRHFPAIDYDEKMVLISEIHACIPRSRQFGVLPEHWRNIIARTHEKWTPVEKRDVEVIISRLEKLRNVPNFYLRNINISVVQDAVRMQFNCDGTHIVTSKGYNKFIEDNFGSMME